MGPQAPGFHKRSIYDLEYGAEALAYFFDYLLQRFVMTKAYLTVMAALVSALTFAQEGGNGKDASLDVNINTNDGGGWYTSPVVWIVGAAVFILLLVALTRGSSRSAD